MPASSKAEAAQQINAAISRGDSAYQRGDYDESASEYQKALSLDPLNDQVKNKLAKVQNAKETERNHQ